MRNRDNEYRLILQSFGNNGEEGEMLAAQEQGII